MRKCYMADKESEPREGSLNEPSMPANSRRIRGTRRPCRNMTPHVSADRPRNSADGPGADPDN